MIKLYRAYDAGSEWTEWALSKSAALKLIREQYGTLIKGDSTPNTSYYEARESGDELAIDTINVDPTAQGLVDILTQYASGG